MLNEPDFRDPSSSSFSGDPNARFTVESDTFDPEAARRPWRMPWKTLFSLAAIFFIVTPIWIVVRDILLWLDAPTVVGTVVETKPDGPFPEDMTIRYFAADEVERRVVIRWNYTTARAVGEEVELVYLRDEPDRAMTRIQTHDEGWSLSPYLLFGSIGLGTVCLQCAFPGIIRINTRRRK